jgi:hypothetical protein
MGARWSLLDPGLSGLLAPAERAKMDAAVELFAQEFPRRLAGHVATLQAGHSNGRTPNAPYPGSPEVLVAMAVGAAEGPGTRGRDGHGPARGRCVA